MSQTAEDQTLTVNSKLRSRPDESKTRLPGWGSNCRLAEQIEAETVLLTSDINIETRLKNRKHWTHGQERSEGNAYGRSSQGFTMGVPRQYGNALDMGVTNGDELDWANGSDDDTVPAVVSSMEDFHAVRNLDKNPSENTTVKVTHFLGRRLSSCVSPSPTNDPEVSSEKNLDASPSSSPMETDISSFFPALKTTPVFPALKTTPELSIKNLSSKQQGLSPRQRLLYRYQMEEMMMMMTNENNADENTAELPGGAVVSGYDLEPSTDAGLDIESGFAEPPDSPCSSVGSDHFEETSAQNSKGPLRHCHICGYSPRSKEDYDAHMKKTHFTHKCDKCIYWSRSPGRLNRHMKNFHGEPTDTPTNKKPKTLRKYTCKQCTFFTYVQEEIWNHTRVHVPASKLLSCPHCPFVCAFKHHMQYHMNNHLGYKPFKCPECNYRCNNKSMLNSHKKSHSNDYPYRCGVCNYAAKYRHALNIHLRKKKHFADGDVILDEIHHRPGRTRHPGDTASRNQTSPEHLQSTLHAYAEEVGCGRMWQQESQHGTMVDFDSVKQEPDSIEHSINASYQPVYALSGANLHPHQIPISNMSNVQRLRYSPVVFPGNTTLAVQNRVVSQISSRVNNPQISSIPIIPASTLPPAQNHSTLCEINQPFCISPDGRQFQARSNYQTAYTNQEQEHHVVLSSPQGCSIDTAQDYGSNITREEWPLDLTAKSKDVKAENNHRNSWDSVTETPKLDWYECQHCGIIFPDRILYSMHMEYHSQSDPFQCNLCGKQTKDRREFFNHISQVAHN